MAVPFQNSPAKLRPDLNVGDVPEKNGRSHLIHPDRDIFQIFQRTDVAQPAHHELGLPHLHKLSAHVIVGSLYCHSHLLNGQIISKKFVGVNLHLVLFHKSADARHLGDSGHRCKFITEIPVLKAPEFLEIMLSRGIHEDIFIYPSDTGGIGPEARGNARGESAGNKVQIF